MTKSELPNDIQSLVKDQMFIEARDECIKRNIDTEIIDNRMKMNLDYAESHFLKREFKIATDYYITTIGFIEPSRILARFIHPHLSVYLTNYLIELHKRGYANSQHTQLLFNLFHHRDAHDTFENFLEYIENAVNQQNMGSRGFQTQDLSDISNVNLDGNMGAFFENQPTKCIDEKEIKRFLENFNADAAIQTLIDNDMDKEAVRIAQTLNRTKYYVQLLINYSKNYTEAANQIALKLPSNESRILLMMFGPELLNAEQNVIRKVEDIAKESWLSPSTKTIYDKDYLKLFAKHPQSCANFLRAIIYKKPTTKFANTLIYLLINEISSSTQQEILTLIENYSKLKYDHELVLRLCCQNHFTAGLIKLLIQIKRPNELVNLLISEKATSKLIEYCNTNPQFSDNDWVEIFTFMVSEVGWNSNPPIPFIKKLIKNVSNSLPLSAIVEILTRNPMIPVDIIKNELLDMFTNLITELKENDENNKILLEELETVNNEINRLESVDLQFRTKRCDTCDEEIRDPPYVAFMCEHMFHIRDSCIKRDENDELYCPICGKCNSPNLEDEPQFNHDIDLSKLDLLDETIDMIDAGLLINK